MPQPPARHAEAQNRPSPELSEKGVAASAKPARPRDLIPPLSTFCQARRQGRGLLVPADVQASQIRQTLKGVRSVMRGQQFRYRNSISGPRTSTTCSKTAAFAHRSIYFEGLPTSCPFFSRTSEGLLTCAQSSRTASSKLPPKNRRRVHSAFSLACASISAVWPNWSPGRICSLRSTLSEPPGNRLWLEVYRGECSRNFHTGTANIIVRQKIITR